MRSPRHSANLLITCIAVAVAAVVLALQLLVSPIVGLANEGDFERVMGYAGLDYLTNNPVEKFYGHIVTKFAIVSPGWYRSGYLTSEVLLARSARDVSQQFSTKRLFDLRSLGALHGLLLVLAVGMFARAVRDLARPSQLVAAASLLTVFGDVGYVAALNSFYAQTASLLFALLTLGIAAIAIANCSLEEPLSLAYFGCAALFVCSKPQEAILGPILAIWGIWLARVGSHRWWKRPAVWLAAGLCALSIWYYRQTPRVDIHNVGLFHTVFHELLQNSHDPLRDMDELGLDRDLARYIGMHAYMPTAPIHQPEFQKRFFDRVDYSTVALFYMRHPARFADRIGRAAPGAFRLRPWYLGNFETSTGVPAKTKSRHFALWSNLRARLEPLALPWLIVFFGGNVIAVAVGYRHASARGQLFLSSLLVCLAIAALEFLANSFADALDDIGRHLFVFDALCDLVLVADCAWIAQVVSTHRGPFVGESSDG